MKKSSIILAALRFCKSYLKVHVHIRYILPPGETVRRIVEAFYERSP